MNSFFFLTTNKWEKLAITKMCTTSKWNYTTKVLIFIIYYYYYYYISTSKWHEAFAIFIIYYLYFKDIYYFSKWNM